MSGIVNSESELSKHLLSRKKVEDILSKGSFNLTTLRAGIVVGSGSASFEIIRDLCEKLPIMITPKWVQTKCQPIAIRNVIQYLNGVLDKKSCYNKSYDIAGPDILTYREMMRKYSQIRKLTLLIITVPIMTPKLSSYWLYFVTSTSYKLAVNLVDSMKIDVIARPNNLASELNIELLDYATAIQKAFEKIEQNLVISHWKDALNQSRFQSIDKYIQIPKYGCFKDEQQIKLSNPEASLNKIWAIGGHSGWYYATWLWKVRGFMDKMVGGVGTRRGRTNKLELIPGDAVDFWRVIYANKEERKLLLYAEMKVPGEAWLEFKIDETDRLYQTATFRPRGIFGRIYWYMMLPFHYFIFSGMISQIENAQE